MDNQMMKPRLITPSHLGKFIMMHLYEEVFDTSNGLYWH